MSTVERVQEFFADAHELECVQNTFRPVLDGTRRTIGKRGVSFYNCTGPNGEPFRGIIPTKARDVLALSEDTITYKIGRDDHTVTLRKVATA